MLFNRLKRYAVVAAVGVMLQSIMASCSCNSGDSAVDNSKYIIATYVYQDYPLDKPIDLSGFTHVNYAFGVVNDTYNGVNIGAPECFMRIAALKDSFPDLKVILSIGGAQAAGFSKMAADPMLRLAFAADCGRIIRQYGIDGIDIDWEFPCNAAGSPDDTKNHVYLMRDIRKAIGQDKILSIAGGGDLAGVDGVGILPYVNYINAMTYDLGWAPYHHTSLYRSPRTGWRSVEEVIADYNSQGVPNDRIVLGLGFYGRGDEVNYPGWTTYYEAVPGQGEYMMWDDIAKVPYIANADSVMLVGFDNAKSIAIKCDYIKDNGFLGGFAWRYALDDSLGTLRKTMISHLLDDDND